MGRIKVGRGAAHVAEQGQLKVGHEKDHERISWSGCLACFYAPGNVTDPTCGTATAQAMPQLWPRPFERWVIPRLRNKVSRAVSTWIRALCTYMRLVPCR